MIKLLYWRGRQPPAVYSLYQHILCTRGFMIAESICQSSKSVQSLTCRLQRFEGPAKECSKTGEPLFRVQEDGIPNAAEVLSDDDCKIQCL